MNIWLLIKQIRFKTYESKRFKEEALKMGISLQLIPPEDLEILESQDRESFFYKNKILPLPDAVIPRRIGNNYFAYAAMRKLEHLGVMVVNKADGFELANDKLHTLQVLSHNHLPIPKTLLAKNELNTRFVIKNFKFPVVLKTISGSEGKGIVLCETLQQLEDVFELSKNYSNIILQEFISKRKGQDLRVFVVGGRALGAMLRTGKKESFKSNFSLGGTVENFPLTPELEWLAVESARVMGLDVAGVDILFDEEGFRICEVNASPYFEGFERATGINIPKAIFQFLQLRHEGIMSNY